jgi:hypothetical protein
MEWRGTRILYGDMIFFEETSPSFRWVWDVDVASDQLSAQPRSRSNSEKKTSHNIEQHLYSFDINWD